MNYKDYIQDVVNWPVEGVLFKDITPLLANSNMFNAAIDDMSMFIDENVSIAGIESSRNSINYGRIQCVRSSCTN